jgi:DNA-binding MarR family transcriptional regulator
MPIPSNADRELVVSFVHMSEADVREIMDALRRMVRALRSSHRAAGSLNLTGAQLFVISVLAAADGPLSVGEVAVRTQTDQSTVSVVAARLVNRGLLKRERRADDARRVELSLTPRGRALQKRAPSTVAQQRLMRALHELKPREAAQLASMLHFIVEQMGIGDEPPTMLFDEEKPVSRTRGAARKGRVRTIVTKGV